MKLSNIFWDVIVVGGGPAGLSAALVLGRCQRTVLLCDRNTPRNWASKKLHSFLSRDGISPTEFTEISRAELAKYPNVYFYPAEVEDAMAKGHHFQVTLSGGCIARGKKLLLATGVADELPPIPDIENYFGKSVFTCPYCDGWEQRNLPVVAYGQGKRGFELARSLTAWTKDIVLCTDGPKDITPEQQELLEINKISIYEVGISSLRGEKGKLQSIGFKDGHEIPCQALFFNTPCFPQSHLAQKLGCKLVGNYESTNVPGVFLAGNILGDVQLAIVAAAEGAKAAFGINKSLTREEFERAAGDSASGTYLAKNN
jgi:thioredoxin reductase